MNHRIKFTAALVVAGFMSAIGCVSVDLAELTSSTAKKASGISFTAPDKNSPFVEIKNKSVDKAWQNSKNGNTMGFLSECNTKTDPSLREIESENLAAMTNLEVIESKDFEYNDREALKSTVNGQVDGIVVRLRLVIFKKNGCNYTLSYVGRKKYFQADENLFDNFVESFRAP